MIRKMKISDVSHCARLIQDSFLTVAREFGLNPENAPRYTAFSISPEKLEWQSLEGRAMFVYENEAGEIVGYYSLDIAGYEDCELVNLCVKPEWRHRKIGEELFRHATEQAKRWKFKAMTIGIIEENIVLREWYESLGAKHIGTRKFNFFPFTCGYMKVKLTTEK